MLTLSRAFVSSKFDRKLHCSNHFIELAQRVTLDELETLDIVKQLDFELIKSGTPDAVGQKRTAAIAFKMHHTKRL